MSLVLDRLNAQINNSIIRPNILNEAIRPEIPKKILSKPLSLDILREVLMENLEVKETIPVVAENIISEPIDKVFNGIEDFVGWYETVKDKFSENQNVAFATLVQARDMINPGCGCKRKQRLAGANNYFVTFWNQNAQTDMPKKVMEVANAKTLAFWVEGNEFLKF